MHHSVCAEAHVVWYSASLLTITLYICIYPLRDNILLWMVLEHWLGQVYMMCIVFTGHNYITLQGLRKDNHIEDASIYSPVPICWYTYYVHVVFLYIYVHQSHIVNINSSPPSN